MAVYAPVCHVATARTFSNRCTARCAGVTDSSELADGEC